MFALAAHCKKTNSVTLARDRYGIKPLYYAQSGKVLLFASEVKAFLAHPDFFAQINPEGLREYLTFQNFITDKNLLKDVKILPAGTTLTFTSNGVLPKPTRYWNYDFREVQTKQHKGELTEQLDHLFVQAVNRNLVSDVPVSAYLSGGIDTGAISAVASKQLGSMRTFTIGFDTQSISGLEIAYDERKQAEFMSSHLNTEHYQMVLKSGDMERSIEKLVWHLEEPRVGQSYPNFYAAKLAGSFDKVVLSGAGGDELFAGYPWRYYRAATSSNFNEFITNYFEFWQRLVPRNHYNALVAPVTSSTSSNMRDLFGSVFESQKNSIDSPEANINQCLFFEAKTFLHGLLVVEDKLSMAHGLESRVPFLDNDLVDFAMHIPVKFKLANLLENVSANENMPGAKTNRYISSKDGKLLLRQTLANYVPSEVFNAKKQGFSGPDASWFRGQSIDYVRDNILNKNAKLYDYLDYKTAKYLVNEHLDGKENRDY